MHRNKHRGFTIVELLIVIVVIGILAAITVVAYSGIQRKAQIASATSDLEHIHKAMLMYRTVHGTLPPGNDWYSGTVMPPSATWGSQIIAVLKAEKLISTPGLEKDPWGQYYWYDNNDCTIGQGGFSPIKSVGPDGLLSTPDDITLGITTTC